jgi:uncharacterized protein YqeY
MKTAMRAKDSARLGTIRMLLAAIKQREVDERIVLDDAAVVGRGRQADQAAQGFDHRLPQAGRTDLVDKESAELAVLQAYLPAAPVGRRVTAEVAAIVAELGASGPGDMGKVMARSRPSWPARPTWVLVSAAVKAALSK